MPESTDKTKSPRPPASLFRSRNIWAFSALGIGLPIAWMLWRTFGWLPAIEISRETTWLTEPLREDGYVDYLGYLEDQYYTSGGPLPGEDPWHNLIEAERTGNPSSLKPLYINPVSEFRASLGEDIEMFDREQRVEEFEQDILPELMLSPWKADDHPILADTIDRNQKWYDRIRSTATPVSFAKFPKQQSPNATAGSIVLLGTDTTRSIVDRFLLRASYHFGRGDDEAALNDIDFAFRAVARENLCMIQMLVQGSHENRIAALAVRGLLSAQQLSEETIRLVEKLPDKSMAGVFLERLEVERIIFLDYISWMHRHRLMTDVEIANELPNAGYDSMVARNRAASVDWNALLRHENTFIDRIVELAGGTNWSESHRKIKELCEPAGAIVAQDAINNAELWKAFPDTDVYCLSLQKSHQFVVTGHVAAAAMLLRRRVVQIAARLAIWKLRSGSYPRTLSQLNNMEGFAEWTGLELIDPFTGSPLIYSSTNNSFEIRSLGPDAKRDSEEDLQLELKRKSTHASEGARDYVWKWPGKQVDEAAPN